MWSTTHPTAQSRKTNTRCPECRAPISREEPARLARNMILLLDVRCPHAGSNGGSGGGGGSGGSGGTTESPSSSSNVTADAEDAEDGHRHKKRRQDDCAGPSSVPATSCVWTGPLQDYVCPFGEISCPFAEAGCAFRAALRDMCAHSSDAAAHLLLLMTSFAAVKAKGAAESAAVKAQNIALESRIAGLESDRSSLQRYVSILHGDEGMEWVFARTVLAVNRVPAHTYTGQMQGGRCNGIGRASWGTGGYESYDGEWEEDKMHGQGIMKLRSGDSYDGQWKEGKKHGQGMYKWSNGDSEEGQWEGGKTQGRFIRTEADGARYEHLYDYGNEIV
jgi:hypothetical protein